MTTKSRIAWQTLAVQTSSLTLTDSSRKYRLIIPSWTTLSGGRTAPLLTPGICTERGEPSRNLGTVGRRPEGANRRRRVVEARAGEGRGAELESDT